ncbi:conjugative transposon protein TraM [Dyadobacter jiangsuensis]
MTELPYTEQFLRQRRFYLALPLLALPFLTLLYWKLVVKNLDKDSLQEKQRTGLQLNLPAAELKAEQNMDKLAYYRKADQDSASRAQQIKKDPYRFAEHAAAADSAKSALMGLSAPGLKPKHVNAVEPDAHGKPEKQLHHRLQALDKALMSSHAPAFQHDQPGKQAPEESQPEISRLEEMMAQMQNENPPLPEDPEMNRLDGMLDKLLKLQQNEHQWPGPDHTETTSQTPALAVNSGLDDDPVSLLVTDRDSSALSAGVSGQTGFFGLDEQASGRAVTGLTAVIGHTQQIISGNTVQLRLTSALSIAGTMIAANNFIYGIAALSGERLKIKIGSVRSGDLILPVNLSVYDLDGIEGIYIPGALSRTVAKQELGSQLQGYELDAGGFSLGAQAAAAGIKMGKTLFSRKTRLTQLTLNEGYKVLLADTRPVHQ